MDATRHVVPSIWEPWAVVREDLLSGLNLASDHQVRLPKFAIGVVPQQCTVCGGSELVVGLSGELPVDCGAVYVCLTIRVGDDVVIVVVVGGCTRSLGWLVDFRAQIPWSEPPRMAVKMGGWVCKISNFQDL